MPNAETVEAGPKKTLPIIYVLDTSGSMVGAGITQLNEAMQETIPVLKEVAADNVTANIKIGILQFASNAKWITDKGFVFLEDHFWNDLSAGGLTEMGLALKELDEKLSRKAWLQDENGFKVPVLIFITDGRPTDNYEAVLEKVKANNKWFKVATKIGIAVTDDADRTALTKICGSSEAVVEAQDYETMKKLIKVVSVTASMVGSKSRTEDGQKEMEKEVQRVVEEAKPKEENPPKPIVTDPEIDDDDDIFKKSSGKPKSTGKGPWEDF